MKSFKILIMSGMTLTALGSAQVFGQPLRAVPTNNTPYYTPQTPKKPSDDRLLFVKDRIAKADNDYVKKYPNATLEQRSQNMRLAGEAAKNEWLATNKKADSSQNKKPTSSKTKTTTLSPPATTPTDASDKAEEAQLAELAKINEAKAAADKAKADAEKAAADKVASDKVAADKSKAEAELADESKNKNALVVDDNIYIKDDQKNSGNCGNYGGTNCTTSQAINQTATQTDTIANTIGSYAVQNAGSKAQAGLIEKGADATLTDANEAQISAMKAARNAQVGVGGLNSGLALYQGYRAIKHFQSASQNGVVSDNQSAALKNIDTYNQAMSKTKNKEDAMNTVRNMPDVYQQTFANDYNSKWTSSYNANIDRNIDTEKARNKCSTLPSLPEQTICSENAAKTAKAQTQRQAHTDAITAATDAASGAQRNVINQNASNERRAQKSMAAEQVATAAITAGRSAVNYLQADYLNKQMDVLKNNNYILSNGGYVWNPGINNNNNGDDTPPPAADVPNLVTTDPGGDGGFDGGNPFNPNQNDGGVQAPPAAPFVASNGSGSPHGGSNGGVGTAGGSSAAKDDSKNAAEAAGKSAAGGGFENEGGMRMKSNFAGSAGVGMDGALGDFLKKLGGGEEKKMDTGATAFGADRDLASDKLAVLGREKNIFLEVSKKYVDKQKDHSI